MKAQFFPLFNVNLSQLQLKSTSTQFQLNFQSISSQLHINLRFKSTSASISTSTITSTQNGCDIKATQSCILSNLITDILQDEIPNTYNPLELHRTQTFVSFTTKVKVIELGTAHPSSFFCQSFF